MVDVSLQGLEALSDKQLRETRGDATRILGRLKQVVPKCPDEQDALWDTMCRLAHVERECSRILKARARAFDDRADLEAFLRGDPGAEFLFEDDGSWRDVPYEPDDE